MKIAALIPARGGSKGIPRKNLAMVGKFSLLCRAVMSAKSSKAVDAIFVSSDDPDILEEADRCGAIALHRPAQLALDETPTIAVVDEFLGRDETADIDSLVLLQPTSPFRDPGDVDRCVEALSLFDSALTVCKTSHPVEWIFSLHPDGRIHVPDSGFPVRRQGVADRFRLAGSVYAARCNYLRQGNGLVTSDSYAVEVPEHRALDIDEQIDLDIARALAGTAYDPWR